MFIERYGHADLSEMLLGRRDYHPFPTASERKKWQALPGDLKGRMIAEGEKYIDFEWPPVPAVRFMDFKRNGNRSRYEALHFKRRTALASLVVAECMEGQGRFIDDIINGIWCICEESFWGVPAHSYNSRYPEDSLPDVNEPIIDLFAAETAGLLAWTLYLLKEQLDKVSPLVCERIYIEAKRRILDPFIKRNDFWWMGYDPDRQVNNWNPWINSNCLTAFLILEEDKDRRYKAVEKIMDSLDKFMDVYHPDGGCDEGTSYWGRAGASLFDCLEQLYAASNGKISFYDEPIVKEIGRFIYRSFISGNYFINFADGGAKVNIPGDLIYRYGKRIGDQKLMDMGSSACHLSDGLKSGIDSLLRELPEIFNYCEIKEAASGPPYVRDSWLSDIQVMAARQQEGSGRGLYLAAKGGHNDESHNHNDVGQFIVYSDGKPVIIDVGVETYTAKTFSPQRYEIWTMQSAYHNLPTVNGVQQEAGREFKALNPSYYADDAEARLTIDISAAYPKEAGIRSWKRTFLMNRQGEAYVEITDDFILDKPSDDIMFSLMTPCQLKAYTPDSFILQGPDVGDTLIELYNMAPSIISEHIEIKDDRLRPVWGDSLFRIKLRAKAPAGRSVWKMKITRR